jgi:peptide chain release factor subunit 3
MLGVLDKTTGKMRKVPFVRAGQTCDVIIELPEAACVETYKDFPQLGRFVLREDGATVGIGVVTSLDAPPPAGDE